MKHFLLIAILASLFSTTVFAVETETECPWTAETNERSNTKQNLEKQLKEKVKSQSTTKQ